MVIKPWDGDYDGNMVVVDIETGESRREMTSII